MCCDSWGRKESDMTEQLNQTELTERVDRGSVMSRPASFLAPATLSRVSGKATVLICLGLP